MDNNSFNNQESNNQNNKSGNTGFGIIIGVMICIIIGLSGFIIYDKFINQEKEENTTQINNNQQSKSKEDTKNVEIDNDTPIVTPSNKDNICSGLKNAVYKGKDETGKTIENVTLTLRNDGTYSLVYLNAGGHPDGKYTISNNILTLEAEYTDGIGNTELVKETYELTSDCSIIKWNDRYNLTKE